MSLAGGGAGTSTTRDNYPAVVQTLSDCDLGPFAPFRRPALTRSICRTKSQRQVATTPRSATGACVCGACGVLFILEHRKCLLQRVRSPCFRRMNIVILPKTLSTYIFYSLICACAVCCVRVCGACVVCVCVCVCARARACVCVGG